ncbi:MAG: hypothetical protein AAGB22_05880 [Bacteroidota bacterium]
MIFPFSRPSRAAAAMALAVVLALAACDDASDEPVQAEFQVVDSLGNALAGAEVTLSCTATAPQTDCIVWQRKRTNARGVVKFTFERPVVLHVRAVKRDSQVVILNPNPINPQYELLVDSICQKGFVSAVEPGELVRQPLVLLQCPKQ